MCSCSATQAHLPTPPPQTEEFITLADPKLCLFADGAEPDMDMTELPQQKITDFT